MIVVAFVVITCQSNLLPVSEFPTCLKRFLKDFTSSLISRLSINDEKACLFIFRCYRFNGQLSTCHPPQKCFPPFFVKKKVFKVEGGLVAMDILNFMFTF